MMPAIKFFGSGSPTPIYPSTIPIAQMTSDELWQYYIRPIGAGAVATAGLITLLKTMPTIVAALRSGIKDVRAQQAGGGRRPGRTRSRPDDDRRARRLGAHDRRRCGCC